jgi:3-oxoacyl-[acyl-carrier protein] reductase
MDFELQNRIALVTGGSRGVGAGIARQLADDGVKVIICARPSEALTALESEILDGGGNCIALPVDVLNPMALRATVDAAAAHWGGLDILVNNVGGAIRFGGFEELSDDDWIKAYEFNVMSTVRFTRASLPYLRLSPLKRIINISSITAQQPGLYNPHYSVTKAATVNLGKHLANILAKEKILVNTVCPGPVHSESWESNVHKIAAERSIPVEDARAAIEIEESSKIPIGKVGETEQIAAVVAFLASPLSSWTTGSCFHVNGGKLSSAF